MDGRFGWEPRAAMFRATVVEREVDSSSFYFQSIDGRLIDIGRALAKAAAPLNRLGNAAVLAVVPVALIHRRSICPANFPESVACATRCASRRYCRRESRRGCARRK